jgi:hypothetical protein
MSRIGLKNPTEAIEKSSCIWVSTFWFNTGDEGVSVLSEDIVSCMQRNSANQNILLYIVKQRL